jgi:YidC/Oxa1 family membrane protein insertase
VRFLVGLAAVSAIMLALLIPSAFAESPTPATSPAPTSTPAPTAPVASPSPAPSGSPGASASHVAPTPFIPGPSESPCPLPNPLPAPTAGASPYPHPLCPAVPGSDPGATLAWLFNPIFQTMFLTLTFFDQILRDIGFAIIALTLVIKTLLIPLFRQQIVSQRRMQILQPEIAAINAKFKGNRTKISEETMRLYRERNVNPASGCLPTFLQLFLLLPIYSVISQGLSATNITSALQIFGIPVLTGVQCQAPGTLQPCLDPSIWWLGGLPANVPEILFAVPLPFFPQFGLSLLALMSAGLQLIQTRMMTQRSQDPQTASQQRILLFLPLISIFYGAVLPAGLFIYWIVFTAYSIVQQYLIVGWGSLFPLFGWTPGFAQGHTPRFPVAIPAPQRPTSAGDGTNTDPRSSPEDRAAGTIRPARQRGRTSRRGRRR